MKLSCCQPFYIPSLNYFNLMNLGEIFVFLDDVKLEKQSWQTRNRIKTASGELYLTIPTVCPFGRMETLICDAQLDYKQNWRIKHLNSIRQNYSKSKYFVEIYPWISTLFEYSTNLLSDFTIYLIINIARKIGIESKFYISSVIGNIINIDGNKDYRLKNLCQALKCDTYISAPAGNNYIHRENEGGQFILNKIDLFFQDYEYPVYNQLYGEYLPYMSILDALFNLGFEKVGELIKTDKMINWKTLRSLT